MTLPTPAQPHTIFDARKGTTLPPQYKALGLRTGFNPAPLDQMTVLIMGLAGCGKSTFLSSIPGSLIFTIQEDGPESVPGSRSARAFVPDWASYEKVRDVLVKDRSPNRPFRVICIDTADEWYAQVLADRVIRNYNDRYKQQAATLGEVGREGKGYGDAGALMRDEILAFREAGYGVVITAHLQEKQITSGSDKLTVIRPVLPSTGYTPLKLLSAIKAQMAVIPVLTETKVVDLPSGQKVTTQVQRSEPLLERRLLLKASDTRDEIKGRVPELPAYITLSPTDGWADLQAAYASACTKAQATHETLTETTPAK